MYKPEKNHDGYDNSEVDINNAIHFLQVAKMKQVFKLANAKSTCDRRRVGAAIFNMDQKTIGIGVNTSFGDTLTCDEIGHKMVKDSCKRTVHAEVNAIFDALDSGCNTKGATMYCTDKPCIDCIKIIAMAGITSVYYCRDYPSDYEDLNLGIELIQLDVPMEV